MLDELHAQGIRVIGIYSPYNGNPDKWHGCAPLDFYDTAPQSGTLEDFEQMVAAAHERGMKVVTYFVNIYIDHESEFFGNAEEQYASGDRSSREVSAFHWSKSDQSELPEPAAGPSEWAFSETAGAYYWSLWGEAGLDHTLPGARAELARVQEFWLDLGVDGFMWDAGFSDPAFRELMVDLPLAHTPGDKWLTFESTEAEEAHLYAEFGLTSWFNYADDDETNDYSRVVSGDIDAEGLEIALSYADTARQAGRMTHAWSPWGVPRYDDNERMLVQEAALLAGAGIGYGVPSYTALQTWPEKATQGLSQVLTVVNENPALLPSAPRQRLPAGEDPKAFAMLRGDLEEDQTVLLVYNLDSQPATVPVNLEDSRIDPGQTPIDLMTGSPVGEITSRIYQVELEPYGFAFLEVESS
jgi:hypothetical protein